MEDNFTTVTFTNTSLLDTNITSPPPLAPGPPVVAPAKPHRAFLTDEQYELANEILLYVRYVVLAVSLVLTLCNVRVFFSKHMRGATSRYVQAISLAQVTYLLIDLGFSIISAYLAADPTGMMETFLYYALYPGIFIGTVIRRGSYLVLCLVSMERLYAIVRPLHLKTSPLVRFPLVFAASAYLFTLLCTIYIPMRRVVGPVTVPLGGGQVMTLYTFVDTSIYRENRQVLDAVGSVMEVLFEYLTLMMQAALNVSTLVVLRRQNIQRRSMTGTSSAASSSSSAMTDSSAAARRERQMTVTILAATCFYVTLSLPFALHSLAQTVEPTYNSRNQNRNMFLLVEKISVVSVILACSTDFLSFISLSTAYRTAFKTIFKIPLKFKASNLHQYAQDDNFKTDLTSVSATEVPKQ